ncbi:ABC transporter permease [Kineococcus indalonis]|uniref:ABC transporter permease n=1 Tax=Kineococcus indalonis TaxID=2696566 RepID=UPI0014131CC2|nr:ABC transporter permease subunit [Kineococcus indalonis]NAZ86328.1 ABC transporter permease subunit [Kineococcus indalonis]
MAAEVPVPRAPVDAGAARGRRRPPRWSGAVAGAGVVLAVWTLLALTVFAPVGNVPTPWAVVGQLLHDGPGLYWGNASVTTWSALQGYAWGNLAAIALAVLVLLVPPLEGAATQLAVLTYCVPLTAIGPVVLIVSPPGARTTSVFLAALSVVFTSVVGCLLGLHAADRAALDVVRAYGGSRWTALVKVRLTAALPDVFAALKLAAPAAFLGAVLGEYFGGVDSGLGVLITAAQTNLRYAQLWALALLSGAIAGAGYLLVGLVARLVTPWSSTGEREGGTS